MTGQSSFSELTEQFEAIPEEVRNTMVTLQKQFKSEYLECTSLHLFDVTVSPGQPEKEYILMVQFHWTTQYRDRILLYVYKSGASFIYEMSCKFRGDLLRIEATTLQDCVKKLQIEISEIMSRNFDVYMVNDIRLTSWVLSEYHQSRSEEEERLWRELSSFPSNWIQVQDSLNTLLKRNNDIVGQYRLYFLNLCIVHKIKKDLQQFDSVEAELFMKGGNRELIDKLTLISKESTNAL